MIHAINFALVLLLVLLIVGGIVALQVFFSQKPSKWLGLILPACGALVSVVVLMNMLRMPGESIASLIFRLVTTCLLVNVPTLILLGIYWGCRKTQKKGKELEKMHIQDLD